MSQDLILPQTLTGDDLIARAERDPHRPRFHFTSPAGWLNDPNGLTQWDGTYHLFYQYNPHAPLHRRIHWGHATSTDLVHWTDRPVALVPGDTGPDADGCWSGVLVDDHGTPTLVYSGRHGERELPCVATGSPDLLTWTKDPANPVVDATPPGLDLTAFRDHCVWRENGRWRQLIGSGIQGRGGTALLYESDDLRTWHYLRPLLVGDASAGTPGDPDWTGTMWECVDLFDVDGTDLLVFSAWDHGVTHHPLYWTGRYTGDRFTPTGLHRLDYGGRYFYAPQSTRDENGRRIMFGWLQEGRSEEAAHRAGWSGIMSLPRLVTLGPDGELRQQPVPELDRLRRERLDPAGAAGLAGDELDLDLDLLLPPDSAATLTLRQSAGDEERTRLTLTRTGDGPAQLTLDRSRSSLDPQTDTTPRSGPIPVGADHRVALRVLVDHSALEIFANGRPLTARVYPTRPDALRTHLTTTAGARAERFDAWRMGGIWNDRPRPLWP